MTPQEQHPKFYAHPERYLGIEVEFLRMWSSFDTFDTTLFTFTLYKDLVSRNELHLIAPKFKPQQGKQFIKDLEDAIRFGCNVIMEERLQSVSYYKIEGSRHVLKYHIGNNNYLIYIPVNNLSKFRANEAERGHEMHEFDTAAYVDRMRELGYYL